jgi:type 2 lantibiotic biosynthesis protein LanM
MSDMISIRTHADVIESILERGFDPTMPIDGDDFLRLISDAEAIDLAGIHSLPPAIADMGHQFGETGDALTMPVAVGHRWLVRLLGTTPVSLEETAFTDAIVTLVRRLVPVLQQFVQFEAIVSRSARGIDGDHEAPSTADQPLLKVWLDRWQTFPVLASLVTVTLVQWIRAVEEMIRALEHDHAELSATLTGSTTPLSVWSISGDAGDVHLGGRSVMILTFADGARVVFKPKQLAITTVFRTLIDRINAAGYSTPLRIHRAIVRGGHTWEEYVPHRPCDSEAQVARFYRRMGGWIRLLQTFEGRDFWLDNLIADGEYPIFIDLETILQPRRRGAAMSGADEQVRDRIESSPLATNIVAMPVPIAPSIGGEDLGCFATPKEFLSPFRATEIPGLTPNGASRSGFRTWTHPEHAPMVDGRPVPADMWFSAIETGYREMAATIDALAPELLAHDGLVDRLCAYPVRTIFRDTWTCMKIIHRSTAPPLLGSYQRRRQFLERMDRDTTDGTTATSRVIAAEVRAMISLDVPFFSAFGDENAIHPPDASPIPAFFDGTARERVVATLQHVTRSRLEHDVSLLRTSFWTTHPETPVTSTRERHTAAPIASNAWQSAARHVADDIAAARVTADDGTSSWIALTYHPTADIEVWSPIGNDLLSGRAGLVTCFIDQWRSTAEDRWRNLAAEAAHDLAYAIQQSTLPLRVNSSAQAPFVSDTPMLLGAFTGIGGMLATVKLAFEALGEPALDCVWRDTLVGIDWHSSLVRASHDVVGGSIGLGLALTARHEWIDQLPSDLRRFLENIALSEEVGANVIRPPGTAVKLAVLPSERVAQLLIRSRLGLCTRDELRGAIQALLESAPTPGDLLGVIELSGPDAPWWPHLSQLVTKATETRRTSSDRISQIESAELALAMWRAYGDDCALEWAQALAQCWIADFNKSGSWFPTDLADDQFRLSTVRGLPAIASVLRRIGGAPAIVSPMTLDWRDWSPQ